MENKILIDDWGFALIVGFIVFYIFNMPNYFYTLYGFIYFVVVIGGAWKQGKIKLRFAILFLGVLLFLGSVASFILGYS